MILSVIPWVGLYAFYRVQKLRTLLLTYLVIYFGATLGLVAVSLVMIFIVIGDDGTSSSFGEMFSFLESIPMKIILFAVGSLINLYLVRRWSKKWNEQLDNDDTDQIPVKEWNEKILENVVVDDPNKIIDIKHNSNKKIIVGTGIGLTFLILLITGIIVISTTTLIQDTLPFEKEYKFGYYQKGEIIKNKELKIFITNTITSSGDLSNPPTETYLIVGVQVANEYYEKSLTNMPTDFILIDEHGNEFKNVFYSSDDLYNLTDFEEISPASNISRFIVFDLPYDPLMKYELKIEDIGLVCLQNC